MTRTSDKGKPKAKAPEPPDDVGFDLGEATPAPVSTTSDPDPVEDQADEDQADDVDEDQADDQETYPLADGVDEDRATGNLGLYDGTLARYVTTGPSVEALFDNARALGADVDDLDRYSVRRV